MNRQLDSRIGVIALVPQMWDSPLSTRHQILRGLAEYCDVVWIEPTLHWRDIRWHELHRHAGRVRPVGTSGRLLRLQSAFWLPGFFRPEFLRDWIRTRRLRKARRILERRGCQNIVLYIWRPEFKWALSLAKPRPWSLYHIDDEYSFSVIEEPIDPAERELLERVDAVVIHSARLMRRKGSINANTIRVPNGVDFKAYSTAVQEPADLAGVPHPRIGYVGVLKTQLDWELWLELARRRPKWSFVLVGPFGRMQGQEWAKAELEQLRNIHWLGARAPAELPAYVQHMDVCVMFYQVNSYTNCIYPLKLHEYLAAGKPVVSTPIATVKEFEAVVSIAQTTEEWEAALTKALQADACSVELKRTRTGVAQQHDWGVLVQRVYNLIVQGVGERE